MTKGKHDLVVLLGGQRTGTHFLGTCIGSHPEVEYVDEITTIARLNNLKKNYKTKEDLEQFLDKVFEGRKKVILLDVKYGHIYKALEDFIMDNKLIHIKRKDTEAVYYSMIHAEYRRNFKVGEYSEEVEDLDGKIKAKPPKFFPEVGFNSRHIVAIKKWHEKFWEKFDGKGLELEYGKLTGNKQTDKLPKWASDEICSYIGIEKKLLKTGLKKMSPKNYDDYYK